MRSDLYFNNKIKTKEEIKFCHDFAQRAFADLQMSPCLLDSTQLNMDACHKDDAKNKTRDGIDLNGNNISIVDNVSYSDDELSEHVTTYAEHNVMDEYVPDGNYNPEWMKMDRGYKNRYN